MTKSTQASAPAPARKTTGSGHGAPDRRPKPGLSFSGNLDLARAAPVAGGVGMPLSVATRMRAETALGVPLSAVRIERGSGAPGRAGAVALSSGTRIQLAPRASESDLAHELVHVAQGMRHGTAAGAGRLDRAGSPAEAEAGLLAPHVLAGRKTAVRRPRDAHTHRKPPGEGKKDEPQVVIVPVGGNMGSLAAYPALQAVLEPGDWNALSAAARRRSEVIASGGKPLPEENEETKTEVKVPLQKLFRPATGLESWETGGDAWLKDMYRLGLGAGGAAAMGARLQREMLGRWLETENAILAEDVTVALIDPAGKGGGAPSLLFSLRGKPVATADGALSAAEVDRSQNGSLAGIIATVQSEMSGLQSAVSTASRAQSTLQAVKDVAAKGDAEISIALLDEAQAALASRGADLKAVSGEPYASLVSGLAAEIKTYADTTFPARRKAHMEWREKNPRDKSGYELRMNQVEKRMADKSPGFFESIAYAHEAQGDASLGMQIMLTGGAAEQERQLGKAYDAGKISFSQFEQAADAASTRGWIFAGVSVALMLATAGLGFAVLGAEAGLGATVAWGVGSGIVTTAAPMLASNLYTSAHDLSDPAMQAWWKGTSYSGWDIAKASMFGGAVGGAFPLAGRALGAVVGRFGGGAGAATRIAAGELALPEGAVGRTIGRDAMEITIASENVTIQVNRQGYKLFGPAGKSGRALLQSGSWDEMGLSAPGAGNGPTVIGYGSHTAGVSFGQRGWGMISPGSRTPVQFGLWDELALPASRPNSALVPGNVPVPMEGAPGTSLIYSGGTGPPLPPPRPAISLLAGPDNPLGLLAPSAGTGPVPVGPALWPPLGGMKMLPPGPQPFGLLPPASPRIDFVGPLTPPDFRNSTALTSPFLQYGSSILPPTAPGGSYIIDGTGALRYVAYPNSPAFGGGITVYGAAGPQDLLIDAIMYRNALIHPNATAFPGGRGYPMSSEDMRYGPLGLARSHIGPHADTKLAGQGQMLSTRDPNNYLAHSRPYNERIRRTMEGRFRREGTAWSAFNVLGANPRITQGGFVIPEGEYIVQYAPSGKIWRAWYFPFDNLRAYDSLPGDIDTILSRFEIAPARVPAGKLVP